MKKWQDLYWTIRWGASRRLLKVPGLGRAIAFFSDRLFAHHLTADLRRINDLLAAGDLSGRYWVRAGMLLGLVREGRLLAHDRDADFGLLREDLPRLLHLVPTLRQAGFHPLLQFRNNQGQLTELTFRRHSAKFEFFVLEPNDEMYRYYVFGWPPNNLFEVEKQVHKQDFVPFDFLDRTWLRPVDSERELEFMYGDWQTPRRTWNYLSDGRNIVARRPWTNTDTSWLD